MTPDQRRRAMASNHGRTGPELALARALWRRGFRYLTNSGYKARYGVSLPGQPDLVFSAIRVVVFVDGCFWHGCPACGGIRTSLSPFWKNKITRNIARDTKVTRRLRSEGWKVIRVREHAIRTKAQLERTTSRLVRDLRGCYVEAPKIGRDPKQPNEGRWQVRG
jgi:DNA mismatch endonuclease (patch repair protein)